MLLELVFLMKLTLQLHILLSILETNEAITCVCPLTGISQFVVNPENVLSQKCEFV